MNASQNENEVLVSCFWDAESDHARCPQMQEAPRRVRLNLAEAASETETGSATLSGRVAFLSRL